MVLLIILCERLTFMTWLLRNLDSIFDSIKFIDYLNHRAKVAFPNLFFLNKVVFESLASGHLIVPHRFIFRLRIPIKSFAGLFWTWCLCVKPARLVTRRRFEIAVSLAYSEDIMGSSSGPPF